MASPRRQSTLIELIRDRPASAGAGSHVRADRVKPEPMARPRKQRHATAASGDGGHQGFDIAAFGRFFAAGRRLTFPMGYLFIAIALVLASWIGMYTIGYARAESRMKDDQIARLTSTSDPLLAGGTTTASNTSNRRLPSANNTTRPSFLDGHNGNDTMVVGTNGDTLIGGGGGGDAVSGYTADDRDRV